MSVSGASVVYRSCPVLTQSIVVGAGGFRLTEPDVSDSRKAHVSHLATVGDDERGRTMHYQCSVQHLRCAYVQSGDEPSMISTSDKPVPARPVLAGFDGSPTGHGAALWATEDAARRRCPLVLVRTYPKETHVATLTWTPVGLPAYDEFETRPQHARHALEDLVRKCQELFPDVVVTARLREGDAATELTRLVGEVGAELVVVGGSHSGAVSRGLLGGTTDHLLKKVTRPVVVVPQPWEPAPEEAPVLVGVDGDMPDNEVIEFALDFADHLGCPVHAVHSETHTREPVEQHCQRALASARARHANVAVRTEIVAETPADALIARSVRARLLVVGNHHHNAAHRAVRGSVCHTALHHARCPVAIVPAPT